MFGIPMGTTCALPHTDLSLHSYEADFLQGFLKNKNIKLTHTFNSNFRYIYDVLSLNNSRFGDYICIACIQEVKYITDTNKSASFLDLHLAIDNRGRSKTKLRQT